MIHWIRQWFCKHDFMHVRTTEYDDAIVDTYMCKHCGWKRRIVT